MTPNQTGTRNRITSTTVEVNPAHAQTIAGPADNHIRTIENITEADILVRSNHITIRGAAADVAHARQIVEELNHIATRGHAIDTDTVRRLAETIHNTSQNTNNHSTTNNTAPHRTLPTNTEVIVNYRGKTVRAKTPGQHEYVEAIDNNTVIFGIGPAGTGKTYLAMAKAVQALTRKDVSRIILTRPAVEAGEKLGFLPGTLNDKIDPYLRPLHDALREMVDPETIPRLMETGIIEVAPLAYMRGRTLNDSFVILDEAQNTTPAQMKMFLTRLGFNTTMVITGDLSQIDLPNNQESGLNIAQHILRDVPGVHVSPFDADDVVRHRLVSRIVEAYDAHELANRN